MDTQAIILAAGQGTRMNHPELPKVLLEANGRPIVSYVLDRLDGIGITDPVIVIGFRADKVREVLGDQRYVVQETQNGTGSAVQLAEPELGTFDGGIYLIYGDCPCVSVETLRDLKAKLEADSNAAMIITTGQVNSPEERYGRIIRAADGTVEQIVEFNDATPEQRQITEYNAGPYLVRSPWLFKALKRLQPSPVSGEYYLTDIVEFARADGFTVLAYQVPDQAEAQGVNTPEDLIRAEQILRTRN